MIRQARRFSRVLLIPLAVLLTAGLTGGAPCRAGSPSEALDGGGPPPRPTIDPQPPLALAVELVSLQKNARGGVALLLLRVSASVSIAEAVVTAKSPGKLIFADGSAVRAWKVELATAGVRAIPVEMIVPEDGKFILSAEVTGTAGGKTIRRGVSYELRVGVEEPAPRTRDGAIEYPASPLGGD